MARSPAGPLMHEHRVIERVIAVLRRELETLEARRTADPSMIARVVDFIRTYADRCHHGKEEDILFARLAEKDLDRRLEREMQDLIEDHRRSRELTGQLAEGAERFSQGDTGAVDTIQHAMRALVELYPRHIEKEDRHFFKPALDVFAPEERAEVLERFEEFDRQLIHEKYLQVAEDLERVSVRA